MNLEQNLFRSKAINIINFSYFFGQIIASMCHKYNKNYGIMITASHNNYEDNGLKIVDNKGFIIDNQEKKQIIDCYFKNKLFDEKNNNNKYKIYFGYDTRKSSKIIYEKIVNGIHHYDKNIKIVNFGLTTTPEHHYRITNENYLYHIVKMLNMNDNDIQIKIDCANGVGKFLFQDIYNLIENKTWIKTIDFINYNTKQYELLNHHCGSDYYINNKNNYLKLSNGLYASLDGDADRSIFFEIQNNNMTKLYDGDTLSLIYVYYLINYCHIEEKDICVVYTSYSNTGFIEHIKLNYPNIMLKCSKTGVKNCEDIARNNRKIGIYFENNGHGTVLNNGSLDLKLLNYINPVVGDGVINILLILILLNHMKKKFENFDYTKYYLSNFQICNIENIEEFENDENETILLKPIIIVNEINKIEKKYNLKRIFIRKSKTENVLRVLIESDENNHNECFQELQNLFIKK